MNRRKKNNEAVFSEFDIELIILAVVILSYLCFRNFSYSLGKNALMHLFLLLFGFFAICIIEDGSIFPKKIKSVNLSDTVFRAFIIAIMSLIIQAISTVVFTVSTFDQALFYIFAAVSEEIFFRAFIITFFKRINIFLGIIISVIAFAAFHTNYYNNFERMIGVSFGGLMLVIVYVLWDDLTANIFGHMINNMAGTINTLFIARLAFETEYYFFIIIMYLIFIIYTILKIIKINNYFKVENNNNNNNVENIIKNKNKLIKILILEIILFLILMLIPFINFGFYVF